jgi:parallel beta-helix repeat protein
MKFKIIFIILFIFLIGNVSALFCSTLTSGTYTLNQSLTSSGTCFTITGNNVILDFAGFSITGTNTGDGVLISANNTIIYGGIISNFSYGIRAVNTFNQSIHDMNVTGSNLQNILFNPTSNSSISNNILSYSKTRDGYGQGASSNNLIANNQFLNNYRLAILDTGTGGINSIIRNNTIFNASTNNAVQFISSNGIFENNSINTSYGSGIYMANAVNVTVRYNNFYNSIAFSAMDTYNINNSNFYGNSANKTFYDCFRIELSFGNNISSNTCYDDETGMYFLNSDNNIINLNNISYVHPYDGVLIDTGSNNNTITNNRIEGSSRDGILSRHNSGPNNLSNNYVFNNSRNIECYNSSNNIIKNNIINYSSLTNGIRLDDGANNESISNNIIINSTTSGIFVDDSVGNYFNNNSLINASTNITNRFIMFEISNSSHNIIYGGTIDLTGNPRSDRDILGIDTSGSSEISENNSFIDIKIIGDSATDNGIVVASFSDPDGIIRNNNLTNISYNGVDYYQGFTVTANFSRQWYVNINVKDNESVVINGAGVSIKDISSTTIYSGTTNSTGDIPRQNISEYLHTGTKILAFPHNVTASMVGYASNTTTINISSSKNTDVLILLSPTTDTCTYSSGNWNVNCADNCSISSNVNIGGNNLTFEGAGIFKVSANISNIGRTSISNQCKIVIYPNSKFF